ncbi:MAG: anthrone oxygenase family protein [Pseudomonadota bacterium]|nr:anthrone oxygenase family protein [Pseudomonadota bacterium]
MSSTIVTALLWTAALSSGLIAGVYFAFSGFIMQAFRKIDATQSIAAMNAINKTILHSLFMPLFFGSSIVSVVLIIFAFVHWGETGAEVTLVAGAVYFVGMFVCTVLINVPLNNSLSRLDPNSADAHPVWSRYLKVWTNWNHLRTVSSLVTCILCIRLLSSH